MGKGLIEEARRLTHVACDQPRHPQRFGQEALEDNLPFGGGRSHEVAPVEMKHVEDEHREWNRRSKCLDVETTARARRGLLEGTRAPFLVERDDLAVEDDSPDIECPHGFDDL